MFFIELKFIYLFCNIFLLLVFIFCGHNVKQGGSFWKNAFICSLLFVLVMGTRYNRGNDYGHYVEVYVQGEQRNQYLFWLLNSVMKNFFGIGKYMIFYVYAIPFILSAFRLLSHFRNYAIYTFPLLLISMTYFEEYEIRQALGFTFVFLFLDEFLNQNHNRNKKIYYCILFSVCTIMVHSANIIFIVLFLGAYFTYSKVVTYKFSIPLLLVSTYLFVKVYDISYLMPILQFLGSTNSKFAQYTDGNAAEAWFGQSAYQLENERNPIIQMLEVIGNSSLFYFSYKILNLRHTLKQKMVCSLTNLYVLGFCGKQAFVYLEIMSRMSGMLQRMWFLPMAIVLTKIKFSKLKLIEKIMFISMIFVLYEYLKYLFFPDPTKMMFLWDNYNL